MIDRQEKLWLIRQQIAKAIAEIDHGDTAQSCLALANALGAMLSFIDADHQGIEVLGKELVTQRAEVAALTRRIDEQHAEIIALTKLLEDGAIHPEPELPAKIKVTKK